MTVQLNLVFVRYKCRYFNVYLQALFLGILFNLPISCLLYTSDAADE